MYDVIVVGARCAGAPTAMLAARAGLSVLMLERATFPSDTISTHWMLHGAVQHLTEWGLLDRLVESGCPPIEHLSIDYDGIVIEGTPTTATGTARTFAPRRQVLDALLVEGAINAGVELRTGVSVVDVLVEPAGAQVTIQSSGGARQSERARVVVGADGRNSTVARCVGAKPLVDRGVLASTMYGYWSGAGIEGVQAVIRPDSGINMWPTHGGLTVVAVTVPHQDDGRPLEQRYHAQLESSGVRQSRLADAELASPVSGLLSPRNYQREAVGPGWALAGDASQQLDPISAHGITDAFADADGLSKALQAGLAPAGELPAELERFAKRRRRERMPVFEIACRQAQFGPLPADMRNLLAAVQRNPQASAELLGVFAGARRSEDFFNDRNITAIMTEAGATSGVGA